MTTAPVFDAVTVWMADFDKEVEKLAAVFMQFSGQFMDSLPPSTRRRMARDLARLNRRPSLIHNGRKAR
jgi:hypothetical protein